jgi:hypothetical protein
LDDFFLILLQILLCRHSETCIARGAKQSRLLTLERL